MNTRAMKTKLMCAAAVVALGTGLAQAQDSMMSIGADHVGIKGSDVMFPDVKAGADGYLVIHAVKDGKVIVPASIGHTSVKKGDNQNVTITTDYPLAKGEDYVAMLHDETNGNSTYDFGAGSTDVDTPSMQGGQPMTEKFIANDEAMKMGESMASGSMKTDTGNTGTMAAGTMAADTTKTGTMATDTSNTGTMATDTTKTGTMAAGTMATDTTKMGTMATDTTKTGTMATDTTKTGTMAAGTGTMASGTMATPMIDTSSVKTSGDMATFADVVADKDGYLVIHATNNGQTVAPASLGHTAIKAGDNKNVSVTIDKPFVSGDSYVAMLHDETNGNSTYDFGEGSTDVDTPVMANGNAVSDPFTAN